MGFWTQLTPCCGVMPLPVTVVFRGWHTSRLSPDRVSPLGEEEQKQKQRTVPSGQLADLKMAPGCILSEQRCQALRDGLALQVPLSHPPAHPNGWAGHTLG